jgi:hypothetical protein
MRHSLLEQWQVASPIPYLSADSLGLTTVPITAMLGVSYALLFALRGIFGAPKQANPEVTA